MQAWNRGMLTCIQRATEHREQIGSMLSALGVTPPDLDVGTVRVVGVKYKQEYEYEKLETHYL
jgi:hypothetical protein